MLTPPIFAVRSILKVPVMNAYIMKSTIARSFPSSRSARRRRRLQDQHRRLRSEQLESRVLLAGDTMAWHNAELSWDMRRLIEEHYNSGHIRVLFSTSTLGQGVNLSGRNVLNVGEMV